MTFPVSTVPNAVMSSRVQMECQKQSTHSPSSWSARVITMDSQTGTLTVSRHQHPNDVFYHALKPSAVQTWPHISRDLIVDDFYSAEAKLTVCVLGTVVPVPDFSAAEVALVAIPLRMSHETPSTSSEIPHPPSAYTAVSAPMPASRKTRKEKAGTFDAWVLHLPSKASYEVALRVLGQLPGVTFSQTRRVGREGAWPKEMCFGGGGRLGPLSMVTASSKASKKHSAAA